MRESIKCGDILDCNFLLENLQHLESLIELTKNSCLEKEIYCRYYNLPSSDSILLSQERSHYINLLAIALEKVKNLKIQLEYLDDFRL